MPEINAHEPGSFCWADVATKDAETAKKLYGGLFGWEFRDMPAGEGMVYTMAYVQGREVAGLYQMDEAQMKQGWRPRWQNYISVANADAAAAKAGELGGKIVAPPMDVLDVGRMAVIQDPAGAMVSLWEPRRHIGARLEGEAGTVCWNELLTRDIDTAGSFYMRFFGWKPEVMAVGPGPYTLFKRGETAMAGMMALPPHLGPEVPSSWLVYFLVDDCDASVAKGETLGARTVKAPIDIPTVGRFACLQDEQGATFALFKPKPSGQQ